MRLPLHLRPLLLATSASACIAGAVAAQDGADAVVDAGRDRVVEGAAQQGQIDQLADETDELSATYSRLLDELDGLEVYNSYMSQQVGAQTNELAEVDDSMSRVTAVERQIVPLMLDMLDTLNEFIELDLPFHLTERQDRIARLRAQLDRADVTSAEKFRRICEAAQIEADFGRTIEAYRDEIDLGGSILEVNVLRIGRVGLYFQTVDQMRTGRYDRAAGGWRLVEGARVRDQVRRGIRIAERQLAPELLMLPVDAPEARP